LFTAGMIDAAEAVRMGLAEYAVPREQFDMFEQRRNSTPSARRSPTSSTAHRRRDP
jgi:enoyl-CoA hydratase/carnithine racemase